MPPLRLLPGCRVCLVAHPCYPLLPAGQETTHRGAIDRTGISAAAQKRSLRDRFTDGRGASMMPTQDFVVRSGILNARHSNTLLSPSCLQLKSHRLDLLQDLIVGHQPLPHEHPPQGVLLLKAGVEKFLEGGHSRGSSIPAIVSSLQKQEGRDDCNDSHDDSSSLPPAAHATSSPGTGRGLPCRQKRSGLRLR